MTTELNSKDKFNLAHFYETEDFKSFTRLCDNKRLFIAEQILKVSMGEPGSSERVALLQGQFAALDFLLLEIKKIHKTAATE